MRLLREAKQKLDSITLDLHRLERQNRKNPSSSIQAKIDCLKTEQKEAEKNVEICKQELLSCSPYEIYDTIRVYDNEQIKEQVFFTGNVIDLKEGGKLDIWTSFEQNSYPLLTFASSSHDADLPISSWVKKQVEIGDSVIYNQTVKLFLSNGEILINKNAMVGFFLEKELNFMGQIVGLATLLDPLYMYGLGKISLDDEKYYETNYFLFVKHSVKDYNSNKKYISEEEKITYISERLSYCDIVKIEIAGHEFNIGDPRISYTFEKMFEKGLPIITSE